MTRTARAFGACQAVDELKALLRRAEERRLVPAELGLDEEFDLETIRATLRHLLRYWNRPLPERRYARERHVARVAVVHDFDEIVANVGGLAHEYPFVSDQESWIAENRSEAGLHAMVPSPQARWAKVGTLIAFREGEDPTWSTGVVRRLAREDDDTRYVAVETIAHGGSAVTVMPAATPRARAREEAHLCVWLAGRNGVTDEVTLLLPVKAFARGAPVKIRAYERRYLLAPVRLIASGESYRIARYKILGPAV
jgi:hypothetical protein